MLAVVQQQQQPRLAEPVRQRLEWLTPGDVAQLPVPRRWRHDRSSGRYRGQLNTPDTSRVVWHIRFGDLSGVFQREAGFADATCTRQGNQSCVGERTLHVRQVFAAPDKACE